MGLLTAVKTFLMEFPGQNDYCRMITIDNTFIKWAHAHGLGYVVRFVVSLRVTDYYCAYQDA